MRRTMEVWKAPVLNDVQARGPAMEMSSALT